jgi:DNA invertase Pin-like site-specific DNA recombinase
MVQMLGVFAEFERATIIDRVITSMERKAPRRVVANRRDPLAKEPVTRARLMASASKRATNFIAVRRSRISLVTEPLLLRRSADDPELEATAGQSRRLQGSGEHVRHLGCVGREDVQQDGVHALADHESRLT